MNSMLFERFSSGKWLFWVTCDLSLAMMKVNRLLIEFSRLCCADMFTGYSIKGVRFSLSCLTAAVGGFLTTAPRLFCFRVLIWNSCSYLSGLCLFSTAAERFGFATVEPLTRVCDFDACLGPPNVAARCRLITLLIIFSKF